MNIYITFDYELFLGPKTGSVDKCLLEPTRRIMEIGKRNGVCFTFFVDVLYLLKANEYIGRSEIIKQNYDSVCQQIRDLAKEGHGIQLHLHPQWYYSTYNLAQEDWQLDFEHYSLDACPIQDVETMVKEGVQKLKELSEKPVTAFRAGGYCFPHNLGYADLLYKYGIIMDSSAFMFRKESTPFWNFDYSNIIDYERYRFDESANTAIKNGRFEEYPIASAKMYPCYCIPKRLITGWIYKKKGSVSGDGLGVGERRSVGVKMMSRLNLMTHSIILPASIDSKKSVFLDGIMKNAIRKKSDTFVIIGHPKNTSELGLIKLDEICNKYKKTIVTF